MVPIIIELPERNDAVIYVPITKAIIPAAHMLTRNHFVSLIFCVFVKKPNGPMMLLNISLESRCSTLSMMTVVMLLMTSKILADILFSARLRILQRFRRILSNRWIVATAMAVNMSTI